MSLQRPDVVSGVLAPRGLLGLRHTGSPLGGRPTHQGRYRSDIGMAGERFALDSEEVAPVARRLIEFGFSVQFASTNACSVLFESILANSGVAEDKFTADTFLRSISDAHAVVYFDGGQPVLVVKHVWTVMSDGFEKRPILVIPIGAVVTRAFERLLLDGEGDMSGSAVSLLYGLKEFRMNASMSRDEFLSFVAEAGIAHE
jgi:hypothetical protein